MSLNFTTLLFRTAVFHNFFSQRANYSLKEEN